MSRVTLSPLVLPSTRSSLDWSPSTSLHTDTQLQRTRLSSPVDTVHPFCRAYANIMGQVHPRGGVELEVLPSTGPDPTVFRQHPRYPNVQLVSHPQAKSTRNDKPLSRDEAARSPPPPPSARPVPMTNTASDGRSASSQSQPSSSTSAAGPRSLGGLSIPIPLPKPNAFSARPKGLNRKLSRKAAPIQTKKSMGPDPFEARPFSPSLPAFDPVEILGSADTPAGQVVSGRGGSGGVSRTVKAGTFPRAGLGTKRLSGPELKDSTGSVPFPIATAAPTPALASPITTSAPTPNPTSKISGETHRRPSQPSLRSAKVSIKSSPSRRAEREWRAKVAGLASLNRSPIAGGTSGRGPVPPRRTLAPLAPRRFSSPENDEVVTPTTPSPTNKDETPEDKGTPAKSFVSNRSFETLGHYANPSPPPANGSNTSANPGAGVMVSAASPGTRHCSVPRSVVSSFYFDNRTSRVSTHLSPVIQSQSTLPAAASPRAIVEEVVASSPGQPRSPLPPFSSFHLSPASVGPATSPKPDQEPDSSIAPQLPAVLGARMVDIPSGPTTPLKPRLGLATSQSSTSSGPRPTTPIRGEAPPMTPVNQAHLHPPSGPNSPYSPTTAYIIAAESLDASQHFFGGDIDLSQSSDSKGGRHPYARTPSMLIDSPPKQSKATMPLSLSAGREVTSPPLAPCRHMPSYPAQRHQQYQRQGHDGHRPGIKADIVGSKQRSYGGRSTVLSARRVDLTPGMDTGLRPPKSGLPVSDLERWLASTTIAG